MKIKVTDKRLSARDERGRIIVDVPNPTPSVGFGAYWLGCLLEQQVGIIPADVSAELARLFKTENLANMRQYMSCVVIERRARVVL